MSVLAFEKLRSRAWVGRVQLVPSAVSLHPFGLARHDDVWIPSYGQDGTVRLNNIRTNHFVDLSADDVVAVIDNTKVAPDGLRHMQVVVPRQLWLQRARACWWAHRSSRSHRTRTARRVDRQVRLLRAP
jgi:hypothetical protein